MRTYHDYRFKFADLDLGLGAFAQLATLGLMRPGETPMNQIGWQKGRAAQVISGGDGPVTTPAAGDPAFYYIHIRTEVAPAELAGFDFAAYGLIPIGAEEAAEVLGVVA